MMYLVMPITQNSPDGDYLCDSWETAMMFIKKSYGEQGSDFVRWHEKKEEEYQSAYVKYFDKYRHSGLEITVLAINPINDLITMETLFDISL